VKIEIAGNSKETQREQKYYKLLQQRNVSWEMLPRSYGFIETNLGPGAVFDLVRDYDDGVAKTMEHYLEDTERTAAHSVRLQYAMQDLKRYLLEQRIITMTLKPKNILFQRVTPDTGRLIIVDNIGNSDLFPLGNYSRFFACRKILRKWQRFEACLLAYYPNNRVLPGIIHNTAV